MRKIVITIITIFLLAFCLYAATQETKVAKENKPFTAFKGRPESILKKGTDILVLEKFSDQYGSVRFNHQLHVQPMAAMGMECSVCHHYSSPDYFPPCSKCHSTKRDLITFPLNRPSIEGAYHRQCINCHREWSHDVIECSSCHLKKVAGEPNKSISAVTGGVHQEHPAIEAPDGKVYKTKLYIDTMVTFLHKEHVELFELECVDCHRKGNCSLCHPLYEEEKPKKVAVSSEKRYKEQHKSCVSCHYSWVFPANRKPKASVSEANTIGKEKYCQKCHTKTAKQGFDHAQSTGWPLKQYHLKLNCSKCHIIKGEFGNLETGCDVCHRGWNPQNFHHSVTGVALDEEHREIDCEYCHPSSKFDEAPSCSECHGEDIKYPERLPGPRTNEEGKK